MNIKTGVETLRELAFGSISAAWAAIGGVTTHPIRVFCITNNTEGTMYFSIDGTNIHFYVPKGSFKLIDVSSNKGKFESKFVLPVGTTFYVKQKSAPTSGEVTVEAIY